MTKRLEGRETWHRLQQWDKGQTPSERLAGHILRLSGFESIDPAHPLGGRDGQSDLFALKDGKKWTGAVYFPRGQKSFSDITKKFRNDLNGVTTNKSQGLAFVTNQEITKSERDKLIRLANPISIELFHLERISALLDTPSAYGIRLEFLEIEMTREEQLSFFDWYEREREQMLLAALYEQNRYLTALITGGDSYPQIQLCAYFHPEKGCMLGGLQVRGDYPLLDAVIQVKMRYPEVGKSTILNGWKKSLSLPAIYPRDSLRLEPWQVHLECNGVALEFIDIEVRARNGWFIQRCRLKYFANGLFGPTEQRLYEVMGDIYNENSWRLISDVQDIF